MEPTLDVGQRVLVNRFLYRFSDPGIGDIIVFHPPARRPARKPVRRAQEQRSPPAPSPPPRSPTSTSSSGSSPGPATPLAIQDGHPVVNGVAAEEDFIRPCAPGGECNLPTPITIPPDHYFMMGDNRGRERRQPLLGTNPT